MRLERLNTGFSTADTSYPALEFTPGRLTMSFNSSAEDLVRVEFEGVAAFSWQESHGRLLPGEPWDGPCELFGTPLLNEHPAGLTLHARVGLRHIRFNFNEWGRLDVLCSAFALAT